jgi:hypothetical protein
MKLIKGDVFKIKTKIGSGYLQYIKTNDLGIESVRILDSILKIGNISQVEVNKLERWNILFPIKKAVKKRIIEKVGSFEVPTLYTIPQFTRSKHNIRGVFLGWHIINESTLKRELKKSLSNNDLKLSPHGIMNDTLIIELLEKDWRLENWNESL